MPIIFVHGVSTRLNTGHDRVWEEIIEPKLRTYIAPAISNDPKNVSIEEAYWGDVSVPFYKQERYSLPKEDRVKELYQAKGTWLKRKTEELWHRIHDENLSREDIKYLKYLLPAANKRLATLAGYEIAEVFNRLEGRRHLNESITLFLGDVFFYLATRGEPHNVSSRLKKLEESGQPEKGKPGVITAQLLEAVKKAHQIKIARDNEPLIVLSHSMGGQLVYDLVSYYLPKISEFDQTYQDIRIDFWCAAASQVGLFKEMKVFKEDDGGDDVLLAADTATKLFQMDLGVGLWNKNPVPIIQPASLPDTHLNIWWNLWDDKDYLSFTAEPFFKGIFDDLYDSGMSPVRAHTSHFEQEDFYMEFALMLQEAKESGWDRDKFLQEVKRDRQLQ